MASPQIIEGTWEELMSHSEEFRDKKLRLTILEDSVDESPLPGNLAEFLGDFIGCVTTDHPSERDSPTPDFAEFLVQKHREGHL